MLRSHEEKDGIPEQLVCARVPRPQVICKPPCTRRDNDYVFADRVDSPAHYGTLL